MDNQDTACVILARGGSVGLPRKNLRRIGGLSLVARAIRVAQDARSVAKVFVSTDDLEIAQEAWRYGAKVIDRPAALARAQSSSEEGWLHALPFVQEALPNPQTLVFLQCTSPFTTAADIEGCLAEMERRGANCALTVRKEHLFVWRATKDGRGRGVNHDETQPRLRRQDLESHYRETGAMYCVRLQPFLKRQHRFCGRPALYAVDHPPFEIDEPRDFDLCVRVAPLTGHGAPDKAQLAAVRAIVMDFDGVHTDNSVWVDQFGNETICASRSDGFGLTQLRESRRYAMLILSQERNPVVAKRAEKLRLEVQYGADDKVAALDPWLAKQGLTWADILFVGNDVNDRAAMQSAALSACPSDAHPSILAVADWVLPKPGGQGALRAMADALLKQGNPG